MSDERFRIGLQGNDPVVAGAPWQNAANNRTQMKYFDGTSTATITAPGVIGQILRVSDNTGSAWTDTYYHYDSIGNVALHTASDSSPVQPIDQDAYGNVRLGSPSIYHLTTKEFDSSSDLYHFWQSWYDPNRGLFLSIDKFDRLSRFNNGIIEYYQYQYCRRNPMMMIDPDGFSEHKQKGEDAFNEIQEIEKLEGQVLSCFTNCTTRNIYDTMSSCMQMW